MLNNLLYDWEFIKSIKKHDKPCFSDKSLVNVNEWFVTWKRRWKGEMGEKGVIYVNNLIEMTREYYKNNTTSTTSIKKLKDVLIDSIEGLKNLSYTYEIDSQKEVAKEYFNCSKKVENMVEEINNIINSKVSFFENRPKIIYKPKKNN